MNRCFQLYLDIYDLNQEQVLLAPPRYIWFDTINRCFQLYLDISGLTPQTNRTRGFLPVAKKNPVFAKNPISIAGDKSRDRLAMYRLVSLLFLPLLALRWHRGSVYKSQRSKVYLLFRPIRKIDRNWN